MNRTLFIFDLDGTVLDSRPTVAKILNQMRFEDGKAELKLEDFTPWLSLGGKDLISNALEINSDLKKIDKELIKFREKYVEIEHSNQNIYEGALEFISNLVVQNYLVTLCTNKPRNLVEKILHETDLGKYINQFCAGGDTQYPKPHIDNFLRCKSFYEVNLHNIIMFGDSVIDQMMCIKSNIPFVFHSSGYDDGVDKSKINYKFNKYSEINLNSILKKANDE